MLKVLPKKKKKSIKPFLKEFSKQAGAVYRVNTRVSSADTEAKVQGGKGGCLAEPTEEAWSRLLLPPFAPPSPTLSGLPSPKRTQQIPMMNFGPDLNCGSRWVWKTLTVDRQGELKPDHCANRIFACVREIKRGLRFFFTASACLLLLSHFI